MNQESNRKNKRVSLTLDKKTLDALQQISEENAYGSISSSIRIMVKKYGKLELRGNDGVSESRAAS